MAEELITGANPIEDPAFFKKERFAYFPEIEIKDLLDLDDPCPVWEGEFKDSDAAKFHVFTVGGWLVRKGALPVRLNWMDDRGGEHGRTVGGDIIVIHGAAHRAEAMEMAREGLIATLDMFVQTLAEHERLESARNAGIITFTQVLGRRH